MTLVFATAFSVWVLMLLMEVVDLGGFLLEGTVAVVGGAIIGSLIAWYMRRQRRKERRAS